MSIRHFNNQPCPTCKRDTTHIKMQCRECGHINLTGSEQAIRAVKRHFAKGKDHHRRTLATKLRDKRIAKLRDGTRNIDTPSPE